MRGIAMGVPTAEAVCRYVSRRRRKCRQLAGFREVAWFLL